MAKTSARKKPAGRAKRPAIHQNLARQSLRDFKAFEAAMSKRRLKGFPTSAQMINTLIRKYGASVLARSRYLATNNAYATSAKETFVSSLAGSGIKPSSLVKDPVLKAAIQEAWLEWTDEADADGLTDLYGLQAMIASEMFEAGEVFVRIRTRRPEDGLSVPLQLQLIPAEMLPLSRNEYRGQGAARIECGIEFDAIGRRISYRFLRQNPGSDLLQPSFQLNETIVPANEVLHLYRPIRAGQIRGIPHTVSAIISLAVLDAYEDAELERKRIAALFAAFITKQPTDDHPLGDDMADPTTPNSFGLEPGAIIDLEGGQDVKFAEPADVGSTFDPFEYRMLCKIAAGFGVPYADMTGDLRQVSYGSQRGGMVNFRRRIEALQHGVMVFQFCRPVWRRWLVEAVLAQSIEGLSPIMYKTQERVLRKAKWITPKWDWIDPLKDIQAEAIAVNNGFKSRDDTIEASGYDPEETDARIAAAKDRADEMDISFPLDKTPASQGTDPNQGDPNQGDPPQPQPQQENPNDPPQRRRRAPVLVHR